MALARDGDLDECVARHVLNALVQLCHEIEIIIIVGWPIYYHA